MTSFQAGQVPGCGDPDAAEDVVHDVPGEEGAAGGGGEDQAGGRGREKPARGREERTKRFSRIFSG